MSSEPKQDSLSDVLAFLVAIDSLKLVQRRSYVAGGLRRENSAEHSWHVAMAVWTLSRQAGVSLDLEHLLKLAIAHDLGEIDAGDVSVYSARAEGAPDEAACIERLRKLAPATLRELPDLWLEYEQQLTPASHWLKVADRVLPFLHNLSSQGATWRELGIRSSQVLKVMQPIARVHPELFGWMEREIALAAARGWLLDDADASPHPTAATPQPSAAASSPLTATVPLEFAELILRGRDVLLRPLRADDAEAVAAAAAESRDEYGFTVVPEGVPAARAYIDQALRMRTAGQRYPFAVLYRERLVGSTSYYDFQAYKWPAGSPLARANGPDVLEIGYTWLAGSVQRTRCNTEAKFLLLRQAFETWSAHRVRFRTDERNQRSRDAIARLGARFEGIIRGDKPASDGTLRNSAYYSILSQEWSEIASSLHRKLERS